MEIIRGTKEISIQKPTAITVGKFDGVHIGHRKILSMVVKQKEKGLLPAAFTFAPSPESFFSGKPSGQLLTDSEKECILEETGIEILIEYPMDAETAGTEAGVFLENVLAGSLNARYIAAGEDVTFGKMGKGDAGFIMREAPGLGIRAEIIEKVMKDGEIVSSTLVRSYLKRGEMEKVTGLMGRPFFISGRVGEGMHIGSDMGFPTINIKPGEFKILPPKGVYYSKVRLEDRMFYGITNIGTKPTFGDHNPCVSETFIYDYDGDAYGDMAAVELMKFVRPEIRFDSPSGLKDRVDSDISSGRIYFGI